MDRRLHDGRRDGLEPLESLDVRAPGGFDDMLRAMSRTAFGGRRLGEAHDILLGMVEDDACTVVLTVSGAMTVARMDRLISDMIAHGMVDIVVSTGAIVAHGLTSAIGGVHYKHDPGVPDDELYAKGYNRVYDTLEMEANLAEAERLMRDVIRELEWTEPRGSWQINREIGARLRREGRMPSVLGDAFAAGVPVYVPAFTDSELGLDVSLHFLAEAPDQAPAARPDHARGAGRPSAPEASREGIEGFLSGPLPPFNPFLDLHDYARRVTAAERLGILTIGGGVPRNWAQQVGPYIDAINMRLGTRFDVPRFAYGVRICPEPVHWGGLSGCTYSEGVSWGKFLPPEDGGRYAEVIADATIAWPILVRAVMESLGLTDPGRETGATTAEKSEEAMTAEAEKAMTAADKKAQKAEEAEAAEKARYSST